METIYFPQAVTLAFAHSGVRRMAARSLHSFKVEKFGSNTVNLTAPDGTTAYGVWRDTFEKLPEGYTWVKFKVPTTLITAEITSDNALVKWLSQTVDFRPDAFYAVKILPTEHNSLLDCTLMTRDGKVCPYTSRNYFDVVSGAQILTGVSKIIESVPLPVPGTRSKSDPEVWHAPSEYDSIPVVFDHYRYGSFRHSTLKPVAALRLDFDESRNPIYRCGYFGPAPK